eukprot:scaffold136982_cov20-Tisochrysis_lutea.AAC.3
MLECLCFCPRRAPACVPIPGQLLVWNTGWCLASAAPPSHVDIATHRAASCAILCMQELADSKLPPLGVPDYVIVNNAKDPLLVVHKCLTEVAASMWHPPRASLPCTLVLEDLACWQVSRAGMVVVVVDTNCTSNAHHM